MTPQEVSDEMLMALADGELGAAQAAELRDLVARDPAVGARFAQFARTRAAAQAALQAIGDAPAPSRLAHAIRAHRTGAPTLKPYLDALAQLMRSAWAAPAMAALAMAVVGFGAYRLGAMQDGAAAPYVVAGAPVAHEAIAHALSAAASEEVVDISGGRQLRMLASYQLASGAVCRAFEIASDDGRVDALACRGRAVDEDWRAEIVVAGPAPDEAGVYLPASPGALATIENYLAAHEAVRLDPEEETRLRARDWRAGDAE